MIDPLSGDEVLNEDAYLCYLALPGRNVRSR
jgi:hypothetical protein